MSEQYPAYYTSKEELPLSIFLLFPFLAGIISVSAMPGFNYLVVGLGAICVAAFLLASLRDGFFFPAELKLFVAFCCWGILGLFVAASPSLVIEKLRTLVQLIIMAVIVSYYARNTRCVSWLFSAVLVGVLIISIAAIITGDFARAEVDGEEARLAGLTMNSNSFGISVTYGAGILLYFFRTVRSKILKVIIIGTLLVAIRFVIASGSRKSLLGLAILISFWFIFSYGKEIRHRPVLVIVMLIGLVALGFYITYELRDTVLMQRLLRLESEAEGGGSRVTMIKEGLGFIKSNPVLGLGLNNFLVHSRTQLYSHNNYIEILSGTGIPGAILYFMIYAIILWRLHKVNKMTMTHEQKNTITIFRCLMLLLLFLDIGVVSYPLKRTWVFLAIIIGYTFRLQKQLQSQIYAVQYDELANNEGLGYDDVLMDTSDSYGNV